MPGTNNKYQLKNDFPLLATVLENLPVGIFMVEAPTGKPVLLNATATRMLGKGVTDTDFKSLNETYQAYKYKANKLYPVDEMPITLGLQGISHRIDDMEVHKPDGSKILLEASGTPVYDESGKLIYSLVVFSDITQKQAMNELVLKNEERFRKLIASSQDVTVLFNAAGKEVFVSEASERILGYTPEEIIANGGFHLIHPDDSGRITKRFAELLASPGSSSRDEYRLRHKNGSWIHLEALAVNMLHDPDIAGIILNIRDITEHYKAEETKRKSQQALAESEEKYRGLFESIKDGVVRTCMTGYIQEANNAYIEMLGYNSLGELKKKTYLDLTPEKWHPIEAKLVNENIKTTGYSGEYEKEYIRKDGTVFPIRMQTWLIKDIHGQAEGMWAIVKDLSLERHMEQEKKAAHEKLVRSEEKYRTLLNASPEAILIINREGIITEASDISFTLFGKKNKKELLGKSIRTLVPEDNTCELDALISKALSNEIVKDQAIFLQRKDLSRFMSEVSIKSLPESSRNISIFMVVIRDIAQRKLMEQNMLRTERLASLGEMAAVIAHEINQPLSVISMIIENVTLYSKKNDLLNDYILGKYHSVSDNIHKINNIISQIRLFAGEKNSFDNKVININEVIERSLIFIKPQYYKYQTSIVTKLSEKIPDIFGNELKIEQMLLNLLSNSNHSLSQKARKNNGPDYRKTIEISTRHSDGHIYLVVEDNGTGIPEKLKNKIFDPFFTTKNISTGSGLGLHIVQTIAREMGGKINVESETDKFTRMIIKLPEHTLKP